MSLGSWSWKRHSQPGGDAEEGGMELHGGDMAGELRPDVRRYLEEERKSLQMGADNINKV